LAQLLRARNPVPKVLIVGAGEQSEGCNWLNDGIQVIETDVYLGRQVAIIADAHDLPFEDASVDGVVVQAVLEHVIDPFRCVREIHRVLKPGGLVYAETPFMFPVHLGPYDFLRFSLSGHRYLFRMFREVETGMLAGPGTALAIAIRSLVLSLSPSFAARFLGRVVLPFFIFWLKYLDFLVLDKPHAADFACTTYIFGEKTDQPVSEQELIDYHWSRH